MNIEDQVCSLDLAKKLKDIGAKQDSYFKWEKCPAFKNEFVISDEWHDKLSDEFWDGHALECQETYSAFTANELIKIINGHLIISTDKNKQINIYYQPESGTDNSYSFTGENLAEILAKVLIAKIGEENY